MTTFTRRALIGGSTTLATAGALAGPALLDWAKAWAQSAPWKPERGAQLSMLRWKYFVQSEDDAFVALMEAFTKATGVKVKERLPDYVLAMADQLVNVDVSAEDLRERLQSGKIYPAERIERALENFFTPGNLTRLRELTLTEMADAVHRMAQRVRIPVVADGDTGHGDLHNVVRTVREFEQAGAAGGPDRPNAMWYPSRRL